MSQPSSLSLLYFPQPLSFSPDVPFIHRNAYKRIVLLLWREIRGPPPVKPSSQHSLSPAPSHLACCSSHNPQSSLSTGTIMIRQCHTTNYLFSSGKAVSQCVQRFKQGRHFLQQWKQITFFLSMCIGVFSSLARKMYDYTKRFHCSHLSLKTYIKPLRKSPNLIPPTATSDPSTRA